jgi:hypothetical protein
LSKKVKHELRHIEKPFLKFQSLVNSPGYSLVPEETDKLDAYLTDSFYALATEKEGYPLLKTILQKIDAVIDSKKMKLKSSRLRKAKDQIHKIVDKNALLALQMECIEILNKKCQLFSSGKINDYKNEKNMLLERLKILELRKSSLEIKDARLEKEYKDTLDKVDTQKLLIEKIVSDLVDKDVQILI